MPMPEPKSLVSVLAIMHTSSLPQIIHPAHSNRGRELTPVGGRTVAAGLLRFVGEGRAGGAALSVGGAPALLQSSNGVSGVVPEEWERRDTRVRAGPWPAAPLLAVAGPPRPPPRAQRRPSSGFQRRRPRRTPAAAAVGGWGAVRGRALAGRPRRRS